MSKWTDPSEWARLRSGQTCPFCLSGSAAEVVAEFGVVVGHGWGGGPDAGYCCLVFRRHAVELHDLTTAEAAAFVRDVQRVSHAVAVVAEPVKMNYEVHGNTLPHLHTQFFPRYVGDPFEGGPVNPRLLAASVYGPGEYPRFVRSLRSALAGVG